MIDPFTITLLASLVGTGMQAFGQYKAGQDARSAERYNAAVARQQAELAKQSAELEVGKLDRAKGKLSGQQRAAYGKAGVTLSGSPFEVMVDTAAQFELDKMITRYNANVNASNMYSQADMREEFGRRYYQAGMVNAGATLLSGIGNIGLKTKFGS